MQRAAVGSAGPGGGGAARYPRSKESDESGSGWESEVRDGPPFGCMLAAFSTQGEVRVGLSLMP